MSSFIDKKGKILHHREFQIQQICVERGIQTLCHFTRIENLKSILQRGLVGRSILEEIEIQFLWNDPNRYDRCPEANCLSISFPNYQMFYGIRERKKEIEGVNDSQWIVLLLDAKVLWELECAFCQLNAADNAVTNIPLEGRKRSEALKGMFADFYHIKHQDLSIPENYPTHPQAEILVFDTIPVEYIKKILFSNEAPLDQWLTDTKFSDNELSEYEFYTDKCSFSARRDYAKWRPKNFDGDGIPLSYIGKNN